MDDAGSKVRSPETVLADIPADARLLLRDHIIGLEAEAGNARAWADDARREQAAAVARWKLHAVELAEERDRALARSQHSSREAEHIQSLLEATQAQLTALQGRVDELEEQAQHVAALAPAPRRRWWAR